MEMQEALMLEHGALDIYLASKSCANKSIPLEDILLTEETIRFLNGSVHTSHSCHYDDDDIDWLPLGIGVDEINSYIELTGAAGVSSAPKSL